MELLSVSALFALTAMLQIVGGKLPRGWGRQQSMDCPARGDVDTHTSKISTTQLLCCCIQLDHGLEPG